MELELEELLQEKYNHLKIEVQYVDLKKYKINVTMNKDNKIEIIYVWESHYTTDVNINSICKIIDDFIIKVYRKENKKMDFGKAIELLKTGKRLQRNGWNGKNQYIELAANISYKNANNEIINVEHEEIGNKAIAFVGTSGVQLGWLASQADMLAEDWKEV